MASGARMAADYDSFAWFYRKHWCAHYHDWAMAVLEKIFLLRLGPGARILDLCCGVGTISGLLAARGYRVTGVDCSGQMLRQARRHAPGAAFIQADAREFRAPGEFDGVLSTFDSLNHVLSARELQRVFRNVFASLTAGGPFAFDLNLEEAYLQHWTNTCAIVESDNAFFVRGEYDRARRLGRTDITMFRLGEGWQRADTTLWQRCYARDAVGRMLGRAGFTETASFNVPADLGIQGPPGSGRAFFLTVK